VRAGSSEGKKVLSRKEAKAPKKDEEKDDLWDVL
jgi:hypothetical protein